MGIITQGDLAGCYIANHKSTEFQGDTTLGIPMFGLPNVVLIEIYPKSDPPPPEATTGQGFWWVNAKNFNIGGCPDIEPILPARNWATTGGDYPLSTIGFGAEPTDVNQVSQDGIFNNLNSSSFEAGEGGGTIGEPFFSPGPLVENDIAALTPGKYYAAWMMANAIDNNGLDISEQAEANWDYRVRDIMICNSGGPVPLMTNNDKKKNRVFVWVRLKDDWVYPNASVTINVDINGYREFIEVADFTTGSDRRLKKNIKLIGKSLSGLKIYSFEYINKKFGDGFYQGVMSDEIPQYAVVKHEDGYDRVNYSKIDVDFKRVNYG